MSPWEQSCESRWCVGCARDMWGSGRSVSVCDKWILKMLQFLMSHKMWVISPRVMDKSRVLGAAKCRPARAWLMETVARSSPRF